MYWAVRTTLCSALRSDTEQLTYQAVMQPVRMLLMVQLENLLRIWGHMSNLFSLLRGKRFCSALFTTVLVCLDHDSLLVMWTPRKLKLSTLVHSVWFVAITTCDCDHFILLGKIYEHSLVA